jgi:hypothetical protein
MTLKADLLSRFLEGQAAPPLFVPDLTLWYEWHQSRGTLPEAWQGLSLPEIARRLDVPIWLPVQLWRIETAGVETQTVEEADERTVTHETPAGTLTARWTLGPDGDWWQTEYPVRSEGDLEAAVELIESRSYVLDTTRLSDLRAEVGQGGVVALALPKRPYSEILHDFLGWSDGLLLLGEPEVQKMLTLLEAKLQRLVEQVAELPGEIVLSPDNLDGQFISPGAFERYLTGSYRRTAKLLHERGKQMVIHVGGPIRRLLELLAETETDGIQGICGPPQSDASLAEARRVLGSGMTLWGGIPQDVLLDTHPWEAFETAVGQAVEQSREKERMILGVADRVPVQAELDRLKAIPSLTRVGRST